MALFSRKKKEPLLPWIALQSVDDLTQAYAASAEQPALFFKHSTRCGISSMALNRFEKEWEETAGCQLYYIDLLAHRDVSNKLAEISGIAHQSPQAILVRDKTVIYDASHSGISASSIHKLL